LKSVAHCRLSQHCNAKEYNQSVAASPKQRSQPRHSARKAVALRPDETRLIEGLRRAQTDTDRRERLLEAILTEDEADLIISLRRERSEKAVPWRQVRAELLRDLEP
jgi:hypothetical protein